MSFVVTPSRGDTMFQVYSVPRPGTIVVGFVPLRIERMQILTDGAAVVEPHAGVDRQPTPDRIASLANAEAVSDDAAFMRGVRARWPGKGGSRRRRISRRSRMSEGT